MSKTNKLQITNILIYYTAKMTKGFLSTPGSKTKYFQFFFVVNKL